MIDGPDQLPRRTVGQWMLRSGHHYGNPFTAVAVMATFNGPEGRAVTIPGFYAGEEDGWGTWRVRFNPPVAGHWTYRIAATPPDPDLTATGMLTVLPADQPPRGFLRATPGDAWGFTYETGEPAFIFGDTVYNLFGMAHCGLDVAGFLQRRVAQGFNLLRVRLPVSPFHPPDGYNTWQTRRTWPWGGSEQAPRFDRFDLDYFRTVDETVRQAEALGLGLELIMEAWGFEFPFNSRNIFVPEWEELWLRYLIARYDAYNCTAIWTLQNEYEFYPNGDWHYKPVADRWALRVARWVKAQAGHGHIVAVHNGPRLPPFADRFAADPEAIDAIMYQEWGTRGERDGWLAAGIEELIDASLTGWTGSAIFAEWGYERNPDFPLLLPSHQFCDVEHTRRGAWRGAFCGLGIIHGFENSWGPFARLEEDQPGLADLLQVRHFFTEVLPFHQLRPAPTLLVPGEYPAGHAPRALASADAGAIAVYLPVGGPAQLALPAGAIYSASWFDPRTGDNRPVAGADSRYVAPAGTSSAGHPLDWVLVLRADR